MPPVPAPAGGRAADLPSSLEKARKRRRLALKGKRGRGSGWQTVGAASQIAVGVTAATTQGVQGRLCRKQLPSLPPALVPPQEEERAAEIASCRWPYAPRETLLVKAERDVRVRVERRASSQAKTLCGPRLLLRIFRPSAGRPGNNRAVHPPRIALLQLGGVAKLSARTARRGLSMRHNSQYATFGLPTFVRYFDRRNVASEARPRDNRILSTARLRIKCGLSGRKE